MSKKFITYLFVIGFLSFGITVHAASFAVMVDTGGESINALEGTLALPADARVENISTGDSSIIVWVKAPAVGGNKITFAGITPGGFNGQSKVFVISGITRQQAGLIVLSDVVGLKNDGAGTPAKVRLYIDVAPVPAADSLAPQAFAVKLASSPELFNGKGFAVFLAQDKESGIDHYEAAEKIFGGPSAGDWQVAASPYQIKDGLGIKNLYIKAVDKAGNITVEKLPLQNRHTIELLLAILILVLCAPYVRRR